MFGMMGLLMALLQGGYVRRKMSGREKSMAIKVMIFNFYIIVLSVHLLVCLFCTDYPTTWVGQPTFFLWTLAISDNPCFYCTYKTNGMPRKLKCNSNTFIHLMYILYFVG